MKMMMNTYDKMIGRRRWGKNISENKIRPNKVDQIS